MSPIEKALRFVIRTLAAGLILVSVLLFSTYVFYLVGGKKVEANISDNILKALPLLAGIVLWIKSGSLAEQLSDHFEG